VTFEWRAGNMAGSCGGADVLVTNGSRIYKRSTCCIPPRMYIAGIVIVIYNIVE
jgi:hypothetical protein